MLEKGYGIMPNEVLFDNNISSTAKLIYVYISSLCAKNGYCWASNENIAEKFDLNQTTVSTIINNQLNKYLTFEVSGTRRTIRLIASTEVNDSFGKIKSFRKSRSKLLKNQKVAFEKSKHNNTSIILQTNSTSLSDEVPDDENSKKAFELTHRLLEKVKQNYSFVKTDPKPKDVHQMLLLHARDGFTWEQVEFILDWSQQDSFWCQNIRSATKLRKQFEALMVRAKSDYDKKTQSRVVSV